MTIQVREGQCYAKVLQNTDLTMLWEVKSVLPEILTQPHARLVNREDVRDVRINSCGTIADGRFFKLVSEPQK